MAAWCFVSVVDDDESVRESLPDLLGEFDFRAEAFASAEDRLASGMLEQTHYLLLDVAMLGMSGPALQQEMAHRRRAIPIVFVTTQAEDGLRGLSTSRAGGRYETIDYHRPRSGGALGVTGTTGCPGRR
jgi:FixJ family two-component response regulator